MTDISEDADMHDNIIATCKEWLNKEDRLGDIHVSDLMDPRLAVLKRKYGIRLTEREVLLFISGRSYHEIIEALVENNIVRRETPFEWQGIKATIDSLPNGVPFEFKSTRSFKVDSIGEISDRYIRQLGYYTAIRYPENTVAIGKLGILYIAPRQKGQNGPALRTYSVRYDDLPAIRADMLKRKEDIMAVLAGTKTFESLPRCEPFMCAHCLYPECGQQGG